MSPPNDNTFAGDAFDMPPQHGGRKLLSLLFSEVGRAFLQDVFLPADGMKVGFRGKVTAEKAPYGGLLVLVVEIQGGWQNGDFSAVLVIQVVELGVFSVGEGFIEEEMMLF